MLLKEFFSKALEFQSTLKNNQDHNLNKDDLFWYIIDHDKLHKDYFFPAAKEIQKLKECGPGQVLELFMPMVKKGCKEYYAYKELKGKLGKNFPLEIREEICQRLYDHYKEDILKEKYKIG